jgi:hypothetical protein
MPESKTAHIDYFPQGWSEEVHDDYYIEWVYSEDPTILVRLDGTTGEEYTVTPITGVNASGEEFVTKPLSDLSREEAFEVAITLVYAINGTVGRLERQSEFTGESA